MTTEDRGLGTYGDSAQLDHDTNMLLREVLAELMSRGVDSAPALASIRRTALQGLDR
ncbi:hypothetical protein [Georgenia yuyongxinii]